MDSVLISPFTLIDRCAISNYSVDVWIIVQIELLPSDSRFICEELRLVNIFFNVFFFPLLTWKKTKEKVCDKLSIKTEKWGKDTQALERQ